MAGMIWTDVGVELANRALLDGDLFGQSPLSFDLYVNNETPTIASVIGDFDLSANGTYAQYQVSAGFTYLTAGGICVATIPPNTYNFAVNALGETVYGWYLSIDVGAGPQLVGAKLITTPFAVPAGGGSLALAWSLSTQKLP